MLNPFLAQTGYRFRNDDGGELDATWAQALNTPHSALGNAIFRVRFGISEQNGESARNRAFAIQHRINGGPWLFSTSPAADKAVESAESVHITGQPTTQQISSGGFTVGEMIDASVPATEFTVAGNSTLEVELALQMIIGNVGGSWNYGDSIEIAMIYSDLTQLDDYIVTPSFVPTQPTTYSDIYYGGVNIPQINYGSTPIVAVYKGSTQIFQG